MNNNIEATKQHCKYVFEVLECKLKGEPVPDYPKQLQDHKLPIFVTWLYDGQLRGCIGTFSHERLSKILSEYALISALQDDRFDPIELKEMENLSVGVSFLVEFLPNQGAYDWQVGKNGIILNLNKSGRKYEATFLPQVAEEEQWDKKTTLKHLLRKAGCSLPLSIVEEQIKITSYRSSKWNLKFKEYKEMKEGKKVGEGKDKDKEEKEKIKDQ